MGWDEPTCHSRAELADVDKAGNGWKMSQVLCNSSMLRHMLGAALRKDSFLSLTASKDEDMPPTRIVAPAWFEGGAMINVIWIQKQRWKKW